MLCETRQTLDWLNLLVAQASATQILAYCCGGISTYAAGDVL